MKTPVVNLFMLIMASILLVSCAAVGSRTVSTEGVDDPLVTQLKVSSFYYDVTLLKSANFEKADGFYRAFIEKDSAEIYYQLYTRVHSKGWGHWDEARFILNGQLEHRAASPATPDLDCLRYDCANHESVTVHFTRAELDSFISTGKALEVRFMSSRVPVHATVKVPIDELGMFLWSVDVALGSLAGSK
jgi:hypothetical protein